MTSAMCSICAHLDMVKGEKWNPWTVGWPKITIEILQQSASLCQTDGCKILLQAVLKCYPDASTTAGIVPYYKPGIFWVQELGELQIYFKMGARDPIWPAFLRSTHHEDPTSHDSLEFVRECLVECLDTHLSCHIPVTQQTYMPSRVLDVGLIDDGHLSVDNRAPVYLVDAIEIIGDRRYACLSHRWNTSGKNIITEIATHEQHKSGIEFRQLDLAYQDTVHILRRLGVRYLWIDSLCIIQDDKNDWASESEMMAKVYSSALFTLARHCDGTTSLACARHPEIVVSETISPPVYARAMLKHVSAFGPFNGVDEYSQILRRGWVYQERLLSPRVIHFMDSEISWECQVVSDCQCKHGEPRARPPDNTPKIWHAEALAPGGLDSTAQKNAIAKRWRDIVKEYSGLELTKQTDRLPAIRGCAEQIYMQLKDLGHIGTDFDDSYSFGLWKHCLVSDMTWESYFGPGAVVQRPPQLFPVPTWSWGSINATANYYYGGEKRNLCAQAKLLRAPDDPRGRHTPAYIILTAQTIPARLKLERRDFIRESGSDSMQRSIHLTPDSLGRFCISSSLNPKDCIFKADFELRSANWDEEAWYDITIVRMTGTTRSHPWAISLVLWRYGKCVPGSGVHRQTEDNIPIYQRIGLLRAYPRPKGISSIDWSKAEKTTIAIE
ncbi:hypothetical protein HBI56_183570 [Parastagonospora nodorum]|uniref:Heterokaryon incompatibility domain-containing protein n=1 Tax=Phaeosphaeria nodorum (strain SN15 / ATCC MYA-4574 / FGSC 10173) TaxID=321614 RepID=A0A7U2FD21_PHANO|nr:hypothetical protein HBH56_192040 [Parastagonospora nodorum]QRD03062.1 hypothetical protein JI435_141620 [Parastagonospora nodorum SN15]KAH3937826.1 hypothetical protein HBH54_009940 [Parastagonospora nodorum]KAH3994120.1 hypothetical protein HBI10_189600 [Parastagonospora nodorum]KAH4013598.1 hypothetical protein HBI13_178430 [Parastagonospora nodorum]